MEKENTSRQKEILTAARAEFIREGIAGARMQAIANNIGVTKAMIHYYFKTKENLFKEVFRQASETLMENLMVTLEQDTSLFQKIEQFIDHTIERFHQYPELTGFVVSELSNHPDITKPIFSESFGYDAGVFSKQIEEAASNYEIAPVDANQVITNILSLSMFPYSARGFLQTMFDAESDDYNQFLEKRRGIIKDTILNWLAG